MRAKINIFDIKNNLDFCEGISPDKVLSFLELYINNMKFDCIDNNVSWENSVFKAIEDREISDTSEEKWYLSNIYIDNNNNMTLEYTDNESIEVYFATFKNEKLSWIRYCK